MDYYWSTNCPIARAGEFTFRYSITSGPAGEDPLEPKRLGWEIACPLEVQYLQAGDGGGWSDAYSFMQIDPGNVAVTGMKTAEDDKALAFRLTETAGFQSSVRVTMSIPGKIFRRADLCTAAEVSLRQITPERGRIDLSLMPLETKTVRIELD